MCEHSERPRIIGAFGNGWMRCCGAALLVWALLTLPAYGQSPGAAAPQANTASAEVAKSGSGSAPEDAMLPSNIGKLADAAQALATSFEPIVAALPRLPGEVRAFADRLADPAQGSVVAWVLELVATFAGALLASKLVPRVLIGLRRRLIARPLGVASILGVLGIEALGVIALTLVAFAGRTLWFSDASIRNDLAVPLLAALLYWKLVLLVVDLVLRPQEPTVRLVAVADMSATRLHQMAGWLVGLPIFSVAVLRATLHAGFDLPSVQVLAIPIGVANALIALACIRRVKKSLGAEAAEAPAGLNLLSHRLFARVWHPASVVFVIVALLAWVLGVLLRNVTIFWALIETAGIVLGAWVAEAVIAIWHQRVARRSGETPDAMPSARDQWSLLIGRSLAIGVWLVAIAATLRLWLVDQLGVISAERWDGYRASGLSAAGTLFAAYVLINAVIIYTEQRFKTAATWDPDEPRQGNEPPPIASRLQTMLPLLRFFILGTILVLAILVALSELGINTTSLVAGASIFGLAISFGSQALVRDIVSGIFFMSDDAFRVGEYIDTGRLKGTVEGMSIRSIRLRHQNGQIHVIPFGQIQYVTNFSRDWAIVKFNLRLMHGADLEKVRKTIKQVGLEMMEDPEIAPELIAPLKLQGVADIDPSAIIVRLKFTARPIQPTFVYRKALQRLYNRFQEKGIAFANTNVVVQTMAGTATGEDTVEIAAAAGTTARARLASKPQ
jgi:moderate conductance mechanosensitive channel